METDTTDTARLYWLEAELEKAARNGLLLERLRDLGMRFLIYRDLREAIDAARAETAVETAGGAMSETMLPGTDVRERVDVPGLPDGITPLTGVFTTHHAGRPHAIVLWQGAPWLVWQHPDGHWVTEAKVQVAALRSEAQGEGRETIPDDERCARCGKTYRYHQLMQGHCSDWGGVAIPYTSFVRAARRGEGGGE